MTKEKISLLQNIKSSLAHWFAFFDIDEHYVIKIFGAKICKKHDADYSFPEITEYGLTTEKRDPRVIVSLTTFPARIQTVYKTISTLLNQSTKPDEVVLWLADEQFPNRELPENLTRLQEFGLSIKWCEDIKSYKKLIPSLREFPNDIIITADDDIFYPKKFVDSLYSQYLKDKTVVHANRAFLVKRKSANKLIMNSRNYVYNNTYLPKYTNELMSGYGTLFPPKSLHDNIFNSEQFTKIIPTNDDVWFWAHAVRNNYKIKVNPDGYSLKLLIDRNVQDCGLWKMNMNNTTVGISGRDAVTLMYNTFPEVKTNIDLELK